jgi:hypothetical protein
MALASFLLALAQLEPRLYIDPNTVFTGAGDVLTHTVTLTEPIITADVNDSPYVTLQLTSTDTRLTLNPTALTWTPDDWTTSKTFTTTVSSTELGPEASNVVNTYTESNSELYQGFQPLFEVLIQTSQPPISPPPPSTPPPPRVPAPSHPPIEPSAPPLKLIEPGWSALQNLWPVILFMLLALFAFFAWAGHSSAFSSKYPKRLGSGEGPPFAT